MSKRLSFPDVTILLFFTEMNYKTFFSNTFFIGIFIWLQVAVINLLSLHFLYSNPWVMPKTNGRNSCSCVSACAHVCAFLLGINLGMKLSALSSTSVDNIKYFSEVIVTVLTLTSWVLVFLLTPPFYH